MNRLLVIDDDRDTLTLLKSFFSKNNFEVNIASTGKEGLDFIRKHSYSVILCDFRLPDADGLEMIKKIKILDPNSKIVIITGYSETKFAVAALKLGALEYVTKPLIPDEILKIVKDATEEYNKNNESNSAADSNEFVIGDSRHAQNVYRQIELIAPTNMSVIVEGETGTGKEYVASEIHSISGRSKNPFVALDCGAIPEDLAGSELFGHVKGAFTGALKAKKGCFELADTGTLFLDEIGNLSYENQIKLLRVLQEGKVRRIGDEKEKTVDVRIIVATNEELEDKINKGEFRLDLFHRLNEFKISIQPLRERPEDIEKFAALFLSKASKTLIKNVNSISHEAMSLLRAYSWDGNFRELQNIIKKAVLFSKSDTIDAEDLPGELKAKHKIPDENSNSEQSYSLKYHVARAEEKAIRAALNACDNNKSKAAELLEIDRKTLYNKMKELNMKD